MCRLKVAHWQLWSCLAWGSVLSGRCSTVAFRCWMVCGRSSLPALSSFTWPGLRGFWLRSSEFSVIFCFVWDLWDGKSEMPILFSTPLRRGFHVWGGLVVDNVVCIFGCIPPLKLPLALSNHLYQARATINISSNLSQLATFSICMKRWLIGLCVGTDARHKQTRLAHLC